MHLPLIFVFGVLLVPAVAEAATEVELVDCRFTPEVKKELQLTSEQVPKVEKVISDLGPLQSKVAASRAKRDQLRQAKAPEEQVEAATKELVALEDQCRDRSHELLKPILTDAQFQKILEMEAVHHHRLSGEREEEKQEEPQEEEYHFGHH